MSRTRQHSGAPLLVSFSVIKGFSVARCIHRFLCKDKKRGALKPCPHFDG
jgi:hypothetical protein